MRADNSIMAALTVMMRLDLEDEKTALRYVRRYAVDVIREESKIQVKLKSRECSQKLL